jgi:uncharacterized protein DUF4395
LNLQPNSPASTLLRVKNGRGPEEDKMKYRVNGSETTFGPQVTSQLGITNTSRSLIPSSRRNAVKRNFILQLGYEDPAPVVVPLQYSALVFQPKVVFLGVVAGILFQSSAIFAALGALLWLSAVFPKLNPFNAVYNRTLGSRPGAFRLGPSPAPRRGAEAQAGAVALSIALLIHTGFSLAAYAAEAILLVAALAVVIGSFCFGAFTYHLLRGRWRFALQTLPWAR